MYTMYQKSTIMVISCKFLPQTTPFLLIDLQGVPKYASCALMDLDLKIANKIKNCNHGMKILAFFN